jgi:hypothetical protein
MKLSEVSKEKETELMIELKNFSPDYAKKEDNL